jgi:hypothetical protein
MTNPNETFGEASVQYNDFVGTAAFDANPDSDAIYELAALDRSQWIIVAYDIYAPAAYVWVVGRDVAPNGFDDFPAIAKANGGRLPAQKVEIRSDNGDAAVRLLTLNKRWSVHALHGGLAKLGIDLVRVEND